MAVGTVFILSMPRSGSTMLQRILCTSKDFSTTSESWFLLPLSYMRKPNGVIAPYRHDNVVVALDDLESMSKDGHTIWKNAVRVAAREIYSSGKSPEARYFIDKTPAYSVVADELLELFPEDKFILLFRDPIDVLKSIQATWGGRLFCVPRFGIELYEGQAKLIEISLLDQKNIFLLRYEMLCGAPEEAAKHVAEFLAVDPGLIDPAELKRSVVPGRLGDPGPNRSSSKILSRSEQDYQCINSSYFRRRWIRNYLEFHTRNSWLAVGYSLESMLARLEVGASEKTFFRDMVCYPFWIFAKSEVGLMAFEFLRYTRKKVWHSVGKTREGNIQ